jgi:hypothetical protein
MKKLLLVGAMLALGMSSTATASQSRYALLEHARGLTTVSNQTAGCQTIAQGCLKFRGSVAGRPLNGSLDGSYTVNWARATTRNGSKCTTAGGEVHVSNAKGDALTLDQTGTLCKTGAAYRFHGSYTVSLGSGRYATTGVGTGAVDWTLGGHTLAGTFKGKFNPNMQRVEGGGGGG